MSCLIGGILKDVSVVKGDITEQKVDAIVNPANSAGTMGGGVALAIRRIGGEMIEDEAVLQAPIAVGSAVMTTAGRLASRYVIHAPTMVGPVERIGVLNVRKAVLAALLLAREKGLKKIAFPGMGTGVGGVDKREAAHAMVSVVSRFLEKNAGFEVVLCAVDGELYDCFLREMKRFV
ncbi:MAG: macro domain-containing protein [archaeon]